MGGAALTPTPTASAESPPDPGEVRPPLDEGSSASASTSLTWVHHPARSEPGRLLLLTVVWAGIAGSLTLLEGIQYGFLATLFLGAAVAPFLFPTRFVLHARGVLELSWYRKREKEWTGLVRWTEDRNGILLSSRRHPSALDGLRGIYLRGGPRDELRRLLTARLGPATPTGGPTSPSPGSR